MGIWKSVKIRLSTYQAIRRLAAEWLCGIDDALARLIAEHQEREQEAQRYEAEYRAQAPGQDEVTAHEQTL